jgi:hypothetical protein
MAVLEEVVRMELGHRVGVQVVLQQDHHLVKEMLVALVMLAKLAVVVVVALEQLEQMAVVTPVAQEELDLQQQ